MEVGKNGREFVRGLTRERTSTEGELWRDPPSLPCRTGRSDFDNPPGGFIVGQYVEGSGQSGSRRGARVSRRHRRRQAAIPGHPARGSLFARFRAVARQHSQLDRLPHSRHARRQPAVREKNEPVRLLQIDVAIKDSRASATGGWVFGTFVYDGSAPGRTPWERMIPVGVMWGNDPGISPDSIKAGDQLKESVINRAEDADPAPGLRGPFEWARRQSGVVLHVVSRARAAFSNRTCCPGPAMPAPPASAFSPT